MDTIYTCLQCGHTQTWKVGGLYPANVPTHCGVVMQAKGQESAPTALHWLAVGYMSPGAEEWVKEKGVRYSISVKRALQSL